MGTRGGEGCPGVDGDTGWGVVWVLGEGRGVPGVDGDTGDEEGGSVVARAGEAAPGVDEDGVGPGGMLGVLWCLAMLEGCWL